VSLPIWTPAEVLSSSFQARENIWRIVEAQHFASTTKLVDTASEQELLEEILETGKPPIPPEAQGLDYLLFTPFRYDTLPITGSRFRAPIDPGVFYGAETIRTAAAEIGYWRWRFLKDSTGLSRLQPSAHTAFMVPVITTAIDLRQPPFNRDSEAWEHPHDYVSTQALGRVARDAGIGGIFYRSVRDTEPYYCAAILTPKAFASTKPDSSTQTWSLTVTTEEAIWMRQSGESFSFATDHWH